MRLDGWDAPLTAAFVREARDVYTAARPACRLSRLRGSQARAERELRREVLIEPLAELGLVAFDGPNDPAAVAADRGRRSSSSSTAGGARTGTHSTTSSRGPGSMSRCAREAAALDDAEIARRLVDVDVPRAELVRLSRGLTPARLARVVAMLDPVELMFAMKKLRARRAPANQAHVTNLKENPALLAADAGEAAARGFAELETTVGVSRYAPLNAIAILVGGQTGRSGSPHAVRRRGAAQPPPRDPRARHLCRDAVGVRHRGGVRRRRRHAVVEGVPRLGVRVARDQGAVHLGRRLRGADGRVGGQVDALPGGAMPLARARGRLAGRAERVDLVHRARALGARRHARGAGRERARRVARPRGRVRQRRDREPFRDPQDGEADGAVPAGHRLRHVRLLVDAALRQHVRRRQLRLARLRRVADDAARLAGRRRDRAARRGSRWSRCASAAARAVQAVFAELRLPARSATRRFELAATCLDSRDLPDRDRSADVLAGDRVLAEGISGLDVARALERRGFADAADGVFDDAAAARGRGLPADRGDHRRRTVSSARRSTTAIDYTRARYRLPARGRALASDCSSCRTRSTPGCSARRRGAARWSRRLGRRPPGAARRRGRDRGRAGVR